MTEFIIGALLIFSIWIAVYVLLKNRTKKLSKEQYNKAITSINNTKKLNPAHAILESHKIFVKTLQTLAKKKTNAAKIIQTLSKKIPNEKDIWKYHGIRNKIAHETDFMVSAKQADKARKVFVRGLSKFH